MEGRGRRGGIDDVPICISASFRLAPLLPALGAPYNRLFSSVPHSVPSGSLDCPVCLLAERLTLYDLTDTENGYRAVPDFPDDPRLCPSLRVHAPSHRATGGTLHDHP